jgi:biopolymer transport protein ExbB/biopolymer transport protein TolQ
VRLSRAWPNKRAESLAAPVFSTARYEDGIKNLLEGVTVTILTSFLGTKALSFLVFLWQAAPAASPAAAGGDAANTFSITEMLKNLGGVALGVVVILLIMSVYSIAIMVERFLTYRAAKAQSREFAPRVAQALKNDRIEEAIAISDKHRRSHLAMVVNSGLQEFRAHEQSSDISGDEIEASKRALQRAIAIKTAEFRRGLSGLATIGSTAPFVGLFGTVFGIINAFRGMKNAESAGIAAVAGGISEALFTTALGLLVAVPAVWLFNYFTGKVDGFIVEMDNSASELIDYFLKSRTKQLKP